MSKLTFGAPVTTSVLEVGPTDEVTLKSTPIAGHNNYSTEVVVSSSYVLGNDALTIAPYDVSGFTVYHSNAHGGRLILVRGKRSEQEITLDFGDGTDPTTKVVLERLAVCPQHALSICTPLV